MKVSIWVLLAAAAFVGTHFIMSHPLRRVLITAVGQAGFLVIYSFISIITLLWLVLAYRVAPSGPLLWIPGDVAWVIVTMTMLLASILLTGSFVRNPALPSAGRLPTIPERAHGVLAITRHPMMWAFALWALCHIAIYPAVSNLILAASILLLALVGAALQDRKKLALQPMLWREWQAKTSYWPFVAIVAGRARLGGVGWQVGVGGALLWIALTWAHIPLYGIAAGVWKWIG